MKKQEEKKIITSIKANPFIFSILYGLQDGIYTPYIELEDTNKTQEEVTNKLIEVVGADVVKSIDDELNELKYAYVDEGFINGYITAIEVLKKGFLNW